MNRYDKSNIAVGLALNFIENKYSKNDIETIRDELHSIEDKPVFKTEYEPETFSELQKNLSSINEKGNTRKSNGVYYTQSDLVSYITINSIKLWNNKLNTTNLHVNNLNGIPYTKTCFTAKVFDPTCGVGEFILGALRIKLDLLEMHRDKITPNDVKKILRTLYGNDISAESIKIAKIRIVMNLLERYGATHIKSIVKILDSNFKSYDFITNVKSENENYDIIIGNPPYVEDTKSRLDPEIKYGNIYANALDNASQILNDDGVLGFVVPLSYVSTPRMEPIRTKMFQRFSKQFILSFSDRPDSLFSSVHQKLCVCLFKDGEGAKHLYTSSYNYWYKHERDKLFDSITVTKNNYKDDRFIPKLGNLEATKIYKKVTTEETKLFDRLNIDYGESLYLNMRATFWIKVFDYPQKSSEYKKYICDKEEYNYIYCLLNSSLFWWYWICISDCWHITQKELKTFSFKKIKDDSKKEQIKKLSIILKNELENTKVYVGTRQIDYEYKHKDCISIIHEIDDLINEIYGLTDKESTYIKNFALRYRLGGDKLEGN